MKIIASVVLVAASLVAVPAVSPVAQEPWMDEIEVGEWTKIFTYGTDHIYFIRDAVTPASSGNARLWVRVERELPDDSGALSSRALVEIDCAGRRLMNLDGVSYAQSNFRGEQLRWDNYGNWTIAVPNTSDDHFVGYVCRRPSPR